jgi:hypothetical protein
MKIFKSIYYLTISSILLTLICIATLVFLNDISSTLVLFTTFLLYSSIILSGNTLLIKYANTTHQKIKTSIILLGFILIGFSFFVFFDIISFISKWNLLIGLSVIYLLIIQLNILGWARENHSFLLKIAFTIILISNLFLASIFFFRLNIYSLRPFLIGTILISIVFLIIGVIVTPKDKITSIKGQ